MQTHCPTYFGEYKENIRYCRSPPDNRSIPTNIWEFGLSTFSVQIDKLLIMAAVETGMAHYRVRVELDAEAGVFYVSESNVPGLHAEASSLDELLHELQKLVPQLIALNNGWEDESEAANVPWELVHRSQQKIRVAC